jgi:hypothetical protein
MTNWRLFAALLLALAIPLALAAPPPRSKSLAQSTPATRSARSAMRRCAATATRSGASLYRLKLDARCAPN